MPISTVTRGTIVTVPLVAATNSVTYVFDFVPPAPPLQSGKTQAQILWLQITYSASAVVGTRVPVLGLADGAGAPQYNMASINTQAAGSVVAHSLLQGVVFFPLSVTGLIRTIPVDGLYAFDRYTLTFSDLANISAADTISGHMQLRLS